ncbi:secondary carrier transporter [Lithospermum erythrorhizon]|uniref:Secondary carrier transporter n=1 Tax=Lithospermum erythrorhizon TaxID=34254 RepID=A0AAV3RVJ2_LITER
MRDQTSVYTLDEALSAVRFGTFQSLLLVYGGLGWIAEAMEMMLLSFIGPVVKSQWNLSPAQESLISTAVFGGMLLGAFSWGYLSDAYGRKRAFLGAVSVSTTAGFASAFSPSYKFLVMFRCIAGMGLGGLLVFQTWFLEFVPTPNRGTWMIVYSSFWTIGVISEAALAWIVMPNMGWRWLVALSAIPSFVVLFFSFLIPESPRFLSNKGRTKEAQVILERASVLNKTSLPNGTLVSDQTKHSLDQHSTPSETVLTVPVETQESKKGFSSMVLLFSTKLLRTTLILWILFFGNTFAYYGIILITSELSSDRNKCGSSISMVPKNQQDDSLYINVFITSLAEVPGLLISATIVDRIGRKLSMVIMFGLSFVLFLPLVTHQTRLITTTLLFGARMFISSTFNVVCIYAPEVYPTNVRSTGVGIASAIGRIGGMICPLVAVGLVTGCHQTAAVMLLASVIFVSGFSVMFFPFETKNRALTDNVGKRETTNSTGA